MKIDKLSLTPKIKANALAFTNFVTSVANLEENAWFNLVDWKI